MRKAGRFTLVVLVLVASGCSNVGIGSPADLAPSDMAASSVEAGTLSDAAQITDGGTDGGAQCFISTVGVFGTCVTRTACGARGGYVSTPGYCAGPVDIECCTRVPNVSDNPPVPAGWKLMAQAAVTPEMTTWAVQILHDPITYPIFSSTTRTFGGLLVLARVEWHPPDFQNGAVHRGVTLYQQA
jgi:hypothetical protein